MWNLRAKKEQQLRPYRDAIARKIANGLIRLQRKIVQLLERIDRRMPLTWKKIAFLLFITVCSAWCGYTFFNAVFPASKSPPVAAKTLNVEKTE